MENTPERLADDLIASLTGRMTQREDAESAIWVYKTANWIISRLEEVKNAATQLAEQDMEAKGQESLRTQAGSAGWTEPKVRMLNEQAWTQALVRDPSLLQVQRTFDQAQAALQQAQEPYMELPESRFFIR